MTPPSDRRHSVASIARMLIAMLLLAVRLATSLVPMQVDDPTRAARDWSGAQVAALAAFAICHVDETRGSPARPEPVRHPDRHDRDCGLCPICHVLTSAALPADGISLPRPIELDYQRRPGQPPPATGPARPRRAAAHPRAPPVLSA